MVEIIPVSERTQFVCIEGERSRTHALNYEVPQRSVMGPLLYVIIG